MKSFEKQTSMASTMNMGIEGGAIIYHSFRQWVMAVMARMTLMILKLL